MNRILRSLFFLLVALLVACGDSNSDLDSQNINSPNGVSPAATATLNFQFALARDDGGVPREVEFFRFIGVDSSGNIVFQRTLNKTGQVELVVPITLTRMTLTFLGGGESICEGLFELRLAAGSTQNVNPDVPRVAPTGVVGLELGPQNSQVPVGGSAQFSARVTTANGSRDVTADTFFQSSFAGLRLNPGTPGLGEGVTPGPFTLEGRYRPPVANVLVGQAGNSTVVRTFDGVRNGQGALNQFFAFDGDFLGGVRVASGDINGDGVADIITGAGPGAAPAVKVFDGREGQQLQSFFAYDAGFRGGVFVGAGDVNGDGVDDIITGAGSGGPPQVTVFSGGNSQQLLASFFAYDQAFTGGVTVALGDVNNDGRNDIITGAGSGGGPRVRVFDGLSLNGEPQLLSEFFAYDPNFTGGVFVGAGDVNGDGFNDIITGAGAGGGPHVKVFDGRSNQELRSFFAYDAGFTGGVRVAAGDVNGDGHADIITGAGPGGGPNIKVFDGGTTAELASFFAFSNSFTGGVFVGGVTLPANNDLVANLTGEVVPGQPDPDRPVIINGTIPDFCHFINISPCPQHLSTISITNLTNDPLEVMVATPDPFFEFVSSLNQNPSNGVQETLGANQTLDLTTFFNCSTGNSFQSGVRVAVRRSGQEVFSQIFPVQGTIKVPQLGDAGLSVRLTGDLGNPVEFRAGDLIGLDRIGNGLLSPNDATCNQIHLDGDNLTIDGRGPFLDPDPNGCNFGIIVETPTPAN